MESDPYDQEDRYYQRLAYFYDEYCTWMGLSEQAESTHFNKAILRDFEAWCLRLLNLLNSDHRGRNYAPRMLHLFDALVPCLHFLISDPKSRHLMRTTHLLQNFTEPEKHLLTALSDSNHKSIRTLYIPKVLQEPNSVFVVHGHDTILKKQVTDTIFGLGLRPVVLHNEANEGSSIIEKFEREANVGYAVVLLTPDDIGRAINSTETASRARQNVVLELGYFLARLGREKVCLLKKGSVELPSDLYGLVEIEYDEDWRGQLHRELCASDLPISLDTEHT